MLAIEELRYQDRQDLTTQRLRADLYLCEFTEDELDILREQAKQNLVPGGESELLKIWRCAHCRKIKPWSDGGTSWTGPSVFSGALGEDERHFLGLCCDDCWVAIVRTLTEIYRRHL